MKSILRFFAVVAVAAGFAATAPAAAPPVPIVMKIATATINDSQVQWMKIYAELVDKNSKGRIKVELFPGSQLGSIPRMIEGTQFGSIQALVVPPEFLSGVDSRFEVLTAPGLFKDIAHVNRTLHDPEFSKAFLALGANKGLKGIGLFPSAPMVFNTRTPVHKLSDLAGKKIRVLASEMQMDQIRRLKGTPVPMSLGDVLPALQQGTIDGVLIVSFECTVLHFYDTAKYIFETDQQMETSMVVVSEHWYDTLPPDLQKVLSDASAQASKALYPWLITFNQTQREAWIKAGGVFTKPSAADHAQLMKLMLPIGPEVTSKKPAEKALYELLLRAAKRAE